MSELDETTIITDNFKLVPWSPELVQQLSQLIAPTEGNLDYVFDPSYVRGLFEQLEVDGEKVFSDDELNAIYDHTLEKITEESSKERQANGFYKRSFAVVIEGKVVGSASVEFKAKDTEGQWQYDADSETWKIVEGKKATRGVPGPAVAEINIRLFEDQINAIPKSNGQPIGYEEIFSALAEIAAENGALPYTTNNVSSEVSQELAGLTIKPASEIIDGAYREKYERNYLTRLTDTQLVTLLEAINLQPETDKLGDFDRKATLRAITDELQKIGGQYEVLFPTVEMTTHTVVPSFIARAKKDLAKSTVAQLIGQKLNQVTGWKQAVADRVNSSNYKQPVDASHTIAVSRNQSTQNFS